MILKQGIVRILAQTQGITQVNTQMNVLNNTLRQTMRHTQNWNNSTNTATTSIVKNYNRIGGAATRMGSQVSTSLRGMLGLFGVFAAGRFIFDTIREFETLDAVLTTTLGNRGDVEGTINMLRDFARETPSSFQEVENAFIRLHQRGIQATPETLRGMGNLAAAYRTNIDDMVHAITAAERGITRRLGTALRTRIRVHGEQITFGLAGVEHTVKRSELIPFFTELGNRAQEAGGYMGAMETQMLTLNGAMEKMGDSFRFLIADLGKSQGLRAALTRLVNALSGTTVTGRKTAKALAETLAGAINFLTTALEIGVKFLGLLEAGFVGLIGSGILSWFMSIKLASVAAFAGFMSIFLIIDDFIGWLQGKRSVIGQFLDRDAALGVWTAIRAAVQWIQDTFRSMYKEGIELFKGLIGGVKEFANTIKEMWPDIVESFGDLVDTGKEVIKFFEDVAAVAWDAAEAITSVGDANRLEVQHSRLVDAQGRLSDVQSRVSLGNSNMVGMQTNALSAQTMLTAREAANDANPNSETWQGVLDARADVARWAQNIAYLQNAINSDTAELAQTNADITALESNILALTGRRQGVGAGLAPTGIGSTASGLLPGDPAGLFSGSALTKNNEFRSAMTIQSMPITVNVGQGGPGELVGAVRTAVEAALSGLMAEAGRLRPAAE